MIEFEFENNHSIFKEVRENQFFVDDKGRLCQKSDHSSYNVLAGPDGVPFSFSVEDVDRNTPVKEILPFLPKIKFPGVK